MIVVIATAASKTAIASAADATRLSGPQSDKRRRIAELTTEDRVRAIAAAVGQYDPHDSEDWTSLPSVLGCDRTETIVIARHVGAPVNTRPRPHWPGDFGALCPFPVPKKDHAS
jgi:hypothetical protein